MEEQTPQKKSNDLVILGFTMSLLAVAMWYIVFSFVAIVTFTGTANGTFWAIVWTGFSALGLILSFLARSRAERQTWQRSFATSGIVLGFVAIVLCGVLFYGLAHKEELINMVPTNDKHETKSEQSVDSLKIKMDQQLNGGH